MTLKPFSVCVAILNGEGKILGVTRKHDWNDWGLPGGKIDPDDKDEEAAIRRETREETGLELANLKFHFVRECTHNGQSKPAAVFTADAVGTIHYDEPHKVDWIDPVLLTLGTFGEFNKETLPQLNIHVD